MEANKGNKFELETPCIILDLETVEKNLKKMKSLAESKGKNLRPHIKTHKCITLAKKQIEYGAIGVCAAKVSEAEKLAEAGINGILLTGPFTGKINSVLQIISVSPALMVTLDHPSEAENLNTALHSKGLKIDVLLDIDAGLRRTGVQPSGALKLADFILSKKNLRLRGIQAYAGHLQHILSFKERKDASYRSLGEIIPIFNKLKSEVDGFSIFSASGTGTFEIDSSIPEVTEHQVGSYVCMDSEYLAVDSSEDGKGFKTFDPALRLLTTVVSVNQKGYVTVDAGLKSLYKDGAVPQVITPGFSEMKYDWFGDEYGKIIYQAGQKAPVLGTVLELIVSHCDPTINLFDHFFITRGDKVVDIWPIELRGCSR